MPEQERSVVRVDEPGLAWVRAEDLAELSVAQLALVDVELEGRCISGVDLVAAFRWLFGPLRGSHVA